MKKFFPMATLLLSACSPLQPVKQDTLNTFAIEARGAAPSQPTIPLSLEVSPMRSAPGYDSPRMIFTRKTHALESFSRNQWVDTPARMLTPLLMRTLEDSTLFQSVVDRRSGHLAQWRLESELLRLQQDFQTTPSQIHLSVRTQLIDLNRRSVIASKTFDIVETSSGDDPYAGVQAANRAASRLLTEITEFCKESVIRSSAP